MDSHERSESSRWVGACAELLAPPADWEPDLRLAHARFTVRADAQVQQTRRVRRYAIGWAAAALVAAIGVAAIPQTQALAQQAFHHNGLERLEVLWYWLTVVRRGPVLMRHFPETMQALHIRQTVAPQTAASAGFPPNLPAPGTLSGEPALSVMGPSTFAAEWEGATIQLQVGPTVTARWADVSDGREEWSELILAQGQARATAPPGFDQTAFAASVLRAAGMRNPDAVLQLAGQPTTVPALLLGYQSLHRFIGVSDLPLRAGFVTMVEEGSSLAETPHVERMTLLWVSGERMYVLSGVPKSPPAMLSGDMAITISATLKLVYATAPPTGGGAPHRVLYRVPPNNR